MAYFQPTFTNNTSVIPDFVHPDFVTGLQLTHTSSTTFTIGTGAARDFTTPYVISFPQSIPNTELTLEVDTTTVGAFGCYPYLPSVAAPTLDTSFGVYILSNSAGTGNGTLTNFPSTTPVVIVATGDNFLLPGYDKWRRIGTVWFSAGSNNLIYATQTGFGMIRNYMLQNTVVLDTTASATLRLVDLGATDFPCHPIMTDLVYIQLSYTPNAAANIFGIAQKTSPTPTVPPIQVKGQTAGVELITNLVVEPGINDGAASFYYKCDAADTLSIQLAGWQETLDVSSL